MTDKEFKRLSRPQLIEIIYQLQLKLEEMTAENERLSQELADKRLRVDDVGNIAEAALGVHNVFTTAQDAAAHYIEEIQLRVDREYRRILKEANEKATEIIQNAQQETKKIAAQAQKKNPSFDPAVESILNEYGCDQ